MTDYLAQLRTLDLDVRGGLDVLDAADRAERIAHAALTTAHAAGPSIDAPFYAAVAEQAASAADAMRAAHRRDVGFDNIPSRAPVSGIAANNGYRNRGAP